MMRILTIALRVASVPIGIGVGLWAALLRAPVSAEAAQICGHQFLCKAVLWNPFARWQSVVFGAGATVAVLLLSLAMTRLRSSI
jgi:hypothetical protein